MDIAQLGIEVETSGVKKATKQLTNLEKQALLTEKATKALSRGLKIASVAVAGFAAISVRNFTKFQSEFNNVVTLLDDESFGKLSLTEGIEGLEQGLKDLSIRTGQTFQSLNKATFDYISATGDAENAIKNVGVAANLALAGGTGVDVAVKAINASITAFGDNAGDAQSIAEKFFTAQKRGVTDIAALASEFNKIGGFANTLKISFDETLASATALTANGAKPTALAFNEFKSVLSSVVDAQARLSNFSPEVQNALSLQNIEANGLNKALQETVNAVDGDVVALKKLLGSSEALTGVLSLTGEQAGLTSQIFNELGNEQNRQALFQDKLKLKQEEAATAFARFRQAITSITVSIGEGLTPALASVANNFANFVGSEGFQNGIAAFSEGLGNGISKASMALNSFFTNLDPAKISEFAEGSVSGLISAFETVSNVVSFAAENFDTIKTVFAGIIGLNLAAWLAGIATALKPVVLLLVANPIGVIITGIAVAGLLLVKNWDKVKPLIDKVTKSFKTFATVISNIPKALKFIGTEIVEIIKTAFNSVSDFLDRKLQEFKDFGSKIIETMAAGVTESVGKLKDAIGGVFAKVRGLFPSSDAKEGVFSDLTLYGRSVITTMADGIDGAAPALKVSINEAFEDAVRELQNNVPKLFANVGNSIKGLFSGEGNFFNDITNAISGFGGGSSLSGFGNIASGISNFLSSNGGVQSIFDSTENFANTVGGGLTSALSAINPALGALAEFGQQLGKSAGAAIAGFEGGKFTEIGSNFGILGGAIGGVIDRGKKPRAESFAGVTDGLLDFGNVRAKNGGTSENVASIISNVEAIVNNTLKAQEATLGSLGSTRILEKKGEIFVRFDGSSSQKFGSNLDAAVGFLIKETLTSSTVSDSIKTALSNAANSSESVQRAISVATIYDDIINDVQSETAGTIKAALDAINLQFENITNAALEFGLDAQALLVAQQREINKIKDAFIGDIDRQILGITNNPALQVQDLLKAQQERLDDALNLDLSAGELAKIERLSLLERSKLLQSFNSEQLKGINNLLTASEQLEISTAQLSINIAGLLDTQIERTNELKTGFDNAAISIGAALDKITGVNDPRLSNVARLDTVRSDFNSVFAGVQAGNLEAFERLPAVADTFLNLTRQVNASGETFNNDFNRITNALELAENNALEQVEKLSQEASLLTTIRDTILNDPSSVLLEQQNALLAQLVNNTGGSSVVPIQQVSSFNSNNILNELVTALNDVQNASQTATNSQAATLNTNLQNLLTLISQGNFNSSELNAEILEAINGLVDNISDLNDNITLNIASND